MAQWKRVYVPGKGYRWTDGKGNYKTNNPSFRNPANTAVNAGASAAKSTAKSAASTASRSASATAKAASRTAENERNASSNAIGYGARKKAEQQASKAPEKSNLKGVSSTNDIARLRREQEAARQAQLAKAERKPPAPKPPTPKPAATQPSRPAATRPATPTAPKKPAAAPTGERRVSAATANRESGNYGTSRTNNPMIDDAMKARMRQREDQTGVGPVKDGARYAADVKSNTQGVGPIKDGNRYASNLKPSNNSENSAIAQKSGSEKLKDAMDKQREKRKQQQQRLLASRRP